MSQVQELQSDLNQLKSVILLTNLQVMVRSVHL